MDNPPNQPGPFGAQPPSPNPYGPPPDMQAQPGSGAPSGEYQPQPDWQQQPPPPNPYGPPPDMQAQPGSGPPSGEYQPQPDWQQQPPPPDPYGPPPDWQTQPGVGPPPPPVDPMTGTIMPPPKKQGASPLVWALSGGAAVVLIVVVLIVIVASGGISGIGSDPEDSDLKAKGTVTSSLCESSAKGKWSSSGNGDLYGANFALQIDCVATFTEQGPDTSRVSGIDRELGVAPEGYEIVLVQFANSPDETPLADSPQASKVSGDLKLGDKTWSFDSGAPEPGAIYVAAVSKGDDLTLEITDDGRTQGMDLRERRRVDEIEVLYESGGFNASSANETASATVNAEYVSGGQRWWVDAWSYNVGFNATRGVYNAESGWLTDSDRVAIQVEFSWIYKGKDGIEWKLNEGDLKFDTGDGDFKHLDNSSEDNGSEIAYVYYLDVPADETTLTIEFAPSGPINWPDEGVKMPITDGAEKHTLTFNL